MKTAPATYLHLIVLLLGSAAQAQPQRNNTLHQPGYFNVRNYHATGNGTTVDSDAINKAIAAASDAGGGTVYFPAGNYLSYTIRLKNNITLYLDRGAAIIAASPVNGSGYDTPEPDAPYIAYQDYAHSHWRTGLICGEGLHDISITGQGMIWGKGLEHITDKNIPAGAGNMAISLKLCRNVTIRDLSILHGGHFAILATGVDNLTIDNLTIDTNRDGMDIDCCRSVRVTNCRVNTPFDDGICLKSSFGLGFARATENVVISGCQVSGYDEGSLLDGTYKRNEKKNVYPGGVPTGRIKMGTESNGGFKNIVISDCVFDFCRGLALETVDGGLLEDVVISNITMRDVVNAPIFLRLGSRMRGPQQVPVGSLRRISISNIFVYNASQAILISGIPGHDIEDVTLKNIRIYFKGGGEKSLATRVIPELEKDYPEPHMFGPLPASGFFIRHVKNIQLESIDLHYLAADQRPAFVLDAVKDASFRFVKAPIIPGQSSLVLKDADSITVYHSFNKTAMRISRTTKMAL